MNFLKTKKLDCFSKSVKQFIIIPTTLQKIRKFIENWHYSKNVNGLRVSYCFAMYCDGELIGAMIFGKLGMANAWKKYGQTEDEVIELRRLCCIDDTPKNTESYFIGWCLRWLKKHTDIKTIVSYADAHYNHNGTIYKATNFEYHGLTAEGRIINHNGKLFHDKAIRTYKVDKNGKKGELKQFAKNLINALEIGEAFYVETPGKHIYTYKLKD